MTDTGVRFAATVDATADASKSAASTSMFTPNVTAAVCGGRRGGRRGRRRDQEAMDFLPRISCETAHETVIKESLEDSVS